MNQLDQIKSAAERGDPQAQMALAQHLNSQGQGPQAIEWFERAARAGQPEAALVMASASAHGQFVPESPTDAYAWLKQAYKAGHPRACQSLSSVTAQGFGCSADWERAIDILLEAVAKGDAVAKRQIGALLYLVGKKEAATDLLHQASRADIIALGLLLRALREQGFVWAEERTAIEACLAHHYPLAADLNVTHPDLVPWSPTFQNRDVRSLKKCLKRQPKGSKDQVEIKNRAPEIKVFVDAVPRFICDYILAQAAPQMKPAQIVDPTTGQTRQDPYRRAKAMTFSPISQDIVITTMDRIMMNLARSPLQNGEQMGVLSYLPGEEYKPHYDCFINAGDVPEAEFNKGGQRVRTALLVLHDDFQGGGTQFPELGLTVYANKGSLIVFENVDENGEPEKKSLHAGDPLTAGTKWIATKWIRAEAYRN